MSRLESQIALEEDARGAADYLTSVGGRLSVDQGDPLTYWMEVSPLKADGIVFFARWQWQSYPYSAPALLFCDGIGGRHDVLSAWPAAPGIRPGSWDVCLPYTQQGYQLHPEWVTSRDHAWITEGNPFAFVVMELQAHLDKHCAGRYG